MMIKSILEEEIKNSIREWDKNDIYAVSLFVYDDNDDPREPTVTLGYNTVENYKEEIENASDEQEAKWNYAFWPQNEEFAFGFDETKEIVQKWIEENNYSEDEITDAFVQVLVDIVKELHASGFIKEQFGKEIPVLIHELEYYDRIAEQNIEANSYELVEDFVKFCGSM